MDKEEREVVINGKPALERLSKEEADLFYSVLLLQVQNMHIETRGKSMKNIGVRVRFDG